MSNQGWPKVNQPGNQCVHGDYRLANQYACAFWLSREPKLTMAKGGMQSQRVQQGQPKAVLQECSVVFFF